MSGIVLDTAKVASAMRIFDMPERVIKVPFSQNATEKLTGITLKSGAWISDVFVQVVTAVGGSTIDIGLNGSGILDNPDGLVNGLSCASAGWFYRDTLVSQLLPGKLSGNYVDVSAALAIGSTATKIKTTAAIKYMINGIIYSKAATDDLFVPSAGDTTGGTKYGGNFLYLDTSGTSSCVAMTTEATTPAGIVWPDPVVADKCCIGCVTYNLSTGVFDVGTTAFNAANTTVAYTNAVSGVNDEFFGLGPAKGINGLGLRLTSDSEISYTTSAHAVAGYFYIVVKGGFE